MSGTAWLFPGQGSQFVGMGRDLVENSPQAREVFEIADQALGFDLTRLCLEGPESELTDTINAQPAILTHSVAALMTLRHELGSRLESPSYTAGHSLGEYSALVASGALDLANAVRMVRARGLAMKRAGELSPGAMAAVLGLDDETLGSICNEAGAVQVANYNAPGQIVISGQKHALDRAVAMAKQAGAKRVIPLAVSIAAHSELMRPAAEDYMGTVEAAPIRVPEPPVISNINALPMSNVDDIKLELLGQLTSSLQWVRSVRFMAESGVTQFLEIGPKDVLAGLNRRIAPEASVLSVGTYKSIASMAEGIPI